MTSSGVNANAATPAGVDGTHDPGLDCWVESVAGHPDFPIQNLPFGLFAPTAGMCRTPQKGRVPAGVSASGRRSWIYGRWPAAACSPEMP